MKTKPEFTKQDLFSDVIVDFDDFYDDYNRNALNYLFWIKAKYPKFKCTLFAIPGKMSREFINLIKPLDWLQFAIHGWQHETNFEVRDWSNYQCNLYLDKAMEMDIFVKGFKAPGWEMTDIMRSVLEERGFWLAEHHKNHELTAKNFPHLKMYCVCHEWCMHGHCWEMPTEDPLYRNGIRQFIEEHGLPFDQNTNFHWISEII